MDRPFRSGLTVRVALVAGALTGASGGVAWSQSATGATLTGTLTGQGGTPIEGARVEVRSDLTGMHWQSLTRRDGRYTVEGLEVGGPYVVLAAAIGFRPIRHQGISLGLGQVLRLDMSLVPEAVELEPLTVTSAGPIEGGPAPTGATTVLDSLLLRLPIINRDLHAFAQLVPQITTAFGLSAAGQNTAFNGMLLDGANERAFFGGNAAGGVWGGRPIPLDAVKAYQISLSPYDVRQGDFSGAQINAITKTGTNAWHGTAFGYWRNEQLARDVAFLRDAPYDRSQFGASIGGPVLRDRLHVFLAGEAQRLSAPAAGPYLTPSGHPADPVDPDTVARFVQLLAQRGIRAGSAGPVNNSNPLLSGFGRLDAGLPAWNSRVLVEVNYSRADTGAFSRPTVSSPNCASRDCFPLTSLRRHQRASKLTTLLRLATNAPTGSYNELTLSHTSAPLTINPEVRAPLVITTVHASGGAGTGRLEAGSIEFAQANRLEQKSYELADHLTRSAGSHRVTAGVVATWYQVRAAQVSNAYGAWHFANLDSLARGVADSYLVSVDRGGGDVTLHGSQYSALIGDRWQLSDRIALTLGIRADLPRFEGHPPYSAQVDAVFGRRTDLVPAAYVLFSPRMGFNWQLGTKRGAEIRGGMGVFAGRPPAAWILRAYQNYGDGLAALRCGFGPGSAGLAPAFPSLPDYRAPPAACANGAAPGTGPVNLLDRHLRFPQVARFSLGSSQSLPGGTVAAVEALYTIALNDYVVRNRNLAGPVGRDQHGRVMYGTIDPGGGATPALVDAAFPEVMELSNQSRNHSYSLMTRLARRFSDDLELSVAYAFSRTRDVQSLRFLGLRDDWQAGRVMAGNHASLATGISDLDQPHKFVATAAYALPWARWRTEVSLFYVGTSGLPYTYVTGSTAGRTARGDLNADGAVGNDPIYVPLSASDPAEIQFDAASPGTAAQQQAFGRFVKNTPCLRRQRGRIMERNSCRSPWITTLNLAVRQSLPIQRGHALTAELQIFNLANLLDRDWGLVQLPAVPFTPEVRLLRHVGQAGPQPIFHFDPTSAKNNPQSTASYYQLQLGLRYAF